MNDFEVLVLVAKATYTTNHPCVTIQNICPRDARQSNATVRLIAIAFQRICLVSPIVLLFPNRTQSAAIETHARTQTDTNREDEKQTEKKGKIKEDTNYIG